MKPPNGKQRGAFFLTILVYSLSVKEAVKI
jgi:hypothetical protein